ncbi:MAG: xylulokinase, partial [Phyllobacteriaceae bacterium]|nr:xylulokinase [Phyllobacteriaceae bacterium]
DLVGELGTERRAPTSLLFVPYLDGCWAPTFDVDVRGAFVGLDHTTDEAAMTQAVLQGVAFALTEAAAGFRANGAAFDRLLGIGGGSRSKVWLGMLADCLGTEIAVPEASELGAAFGAARLGLICATGADPAATLTMPRIVDVVSPDPGRTEAYREAFARWSDLVGPVRAASRPLATPM